MMHYVILITCLSIASLQFDTITAQPASANSINDEVPSGIRVRLNQEALTQLHIWVSGGPLADAIHSLQIPDIRDTARVPLGVARANISATQIKIKEIVPWIPKLDYHLRPPNKIEYSVKIEKLKISGNWDLVWKKFIVGGQSNGQFHLALEDVHVELAVMVNISDSARKAPVLVLNQCNANVEKLGVDIQGSILQWGIEAFTTVFNRKFRQDAGTAICRGITQNMAAANRMLPSLNDIDLSQSGGDVPPAIGHVRLDMGMSAHPVIASDHIDVFLQGQFRRSSDSIHLAPEYSVLSSPASNKSMSIKISETVLNTLLDAMFYQSDHSFEIMANMSEKAAIRLKTTCGLLTPCIGRAFSAVGTAFPDELTTVDLMFRFPPILVIQEDRFGFLGQFDGTLKRASTGEHIFSFFSNVDLDAFPMFVNDSLALQLAVNDATMNVTRSSIGDISKVEQGVFDIFASTQIQSDLNEILNGWMIEIPDWIEPIQLTGMEVWMGQGSIELGADVIIV